MYNNEIIKNIVITTKRKRTFDDYLKYFIIIFPFFFIITGILILVNEYGKSNFESFTLASISIAGGLLLFYFTLKRLNENISFESVYNKNSLTLGDLKKRLEKSFRTNNCYIDESLNVLAISTKMTAFSWGELITIIRNNDEYLINSNPSQPVTIYKDKQNIKKIKAIIAGNEA